MQQEGQRFNRVLSIRLADVSFESPNKLSLAGRNDVPTITQRQEGPIITKLNDEGIYQVSLKVNLSCDFEDNTNVFIAEALQIATVEVADEEDMTSQVFLNGTVVDLIYNSSRQIICDLVTSGGFPEYHLQFVSYEQRYLLENAEKLNFNQQKA